MNFKNLAISAIVIAGVAIFGVVMAAVFSDGSLFATEPSPEPSTAESTAEDPPLRDVVFPDPPEKLQQLIGSQPTVPSRQRSTTTTRTEPVSSDPANTYTWEDGDRTLGVVLQTDLSVQNNSSISSTDTVVSKGVQESIVQVQDAHDQNSLPVFRSQSGGELMTLPGGVLLALDPEMDQTEVESFFSQNNISLDRVSELDFIENGFFVNTGPGFPSLELANQLANQDGVLISSPNWQAERELK